MPRALIIAPNWIGDAVMAEPLLKRLSSQNLIIDVLATPWVAPIFSACPEVNDVVTADFKHGGLGWSLRKSIAKKLQENHYDQAYVLPNSWKSALIPWLAKIPVRIGYHGEMRFGLLNHRLPNPPKKNRPSMVKHYAALAELNPSSTFKLEELDKVGNPELEIKPNETNVARQTISSLFPSASSIFILAPGAEYGPAKQWPLEHFGELAHLLLQNNLNAGIILMGGPKDLLAGQKIIEHLASKSPEDIHRIKNLCGKISLSESIALVSIAQAMASNDSGMMHVAAALKVPQVAFFGSSDPKHTPPLSAFASPLWLGLDCSPCHKRQCPLGHLRCLKEIKPYSALQALQHQIVNKG